MQLPCVIITPIVLPPPLPSSAKRRAVDLLLRTETEDLAREKQRVCVTAVELKGLA